MDMKKLRRSGAKKTEAEVIFQQSRDYFFSNPQQQDDFMILKPMSGGTRFGTANQPEKHPNLSISATNLKIKKAHATTLKDFFSAQKEQIVASYHPKKQKTSTAPLASVSASRQKHEDKKSSELQLQKEKRKKLVDIEEPNPMQFYQRNSTAIVRQILKMSESQLESDNTQDSKGFQQSQQQQYQFQEGFEANPAVVRLPYGDIIRQSVSSVSEKKKKNVQFTETSEYSGKDFFIPSSTSEGTRRIYDQVKENKQKNEKYLLGRKNVHQSLGLILPQTKQTPPAALPSSSKSSRPSTIAEKCREDIQHPRKFYCLSSVHYKNYKYPRPKQMPYEKESEKRTRMPLYLMPQSAPSREIEQICIGKYQSEVNEIQQSIEEKQQHSESIDEKYALADLEATRQSYVSEIEYIQGRATATQQQQRKKFKTNAKYTFGDSKSKALNSINLRNSKMEDISDILFRTKSKIEMQIARTKINVEKVQQEHSIYLQQTQLSMNTSVPQIYKNLVAQSDSLKQNQSPPVPQEKYDIFQKNNEFQNEPRNGEYHNNNDGIQPMYEGNGQQQYGIEEENEEEFMRSDQQQLNMNEQISAQEDYINKYILGIGSQENQTLQLKDQFQIKRSNSQEDHTQIKSLANFTSAQQLTDRDIIKKPQMGKLMVSVLIETFASLKLNRPALRNRILLALGLNPHDDHEIISKQQFELFYTVLVSKTASLNTTVEFIIKEEQQISRQIFILICVVKFFKLDGEEDEDYQQDNQSPLKKNRLKTGEFKRILRLLTISIDEKAKGEEKSLFDYMLENLSLTEVLRDADDEVDLDQFKIILMDGKINPKDIIDLICNLQ